MKKALAALIASVCLLLTAFTLSSCTKADPQIEGRYYLRSLYHDDTSDGLPGIAAIINTQTEYDCVLGGEMDFSKFYLEFKDGKMTMHGSWEVTRGPNYKFSLFHNSTTEFSYELKKSETYSGRYDVYLLNGDSGPFCSFFPATKYSSAHLFRHYQYMNDSEYITADYYLEGSAELINSPI